MRQLIFDRNAQICAWVGARVGLPSIAGTTIGVSDGKDLIAAVVYNGFTGRDIQATLATTTTRWATKGVMRAIHHYPFLQLGCVRITCATEFKNHKVRSFLEHWGFQYEGTLREWFDTGDAAVYGLLKKDCSWIGTSGNDAELRAA